MSNSPGNENLSDDSWLLEPAETFPVGSIDQVVLMLSRFLEWGRVYFVSAIDDSRGRSDAVARKIGAFGLLGIECHEPCQRQAESARLLRDEIYCDAAEVTLGCVEAWAESVLRSSNLLGYNASIVIDAKRGKGGAHQVAEKHALFLAARKQRKLSGESNEEENRALHAVLLSDSVFGATVLFFQSDYTANLYAAVYSRLIPMPDSARRIGNDLDPAKYWSMRYR